MDREVTKAGNPPTTREPRPAAGLGGIDGAYVERPRPERCENCGGLPSEGTQLHFVADVAGHELVAHRWVCDSCCPGTLQRGETRAAPDDEDVGWLTE
jgi:hypothetical protein